MTERTFTAAEMRAMADMAESAVTDDSGGSQAFAHTAAMLRQGATAEAALAEAQREIARLATESSSLSDAYDTALSQRDEANDALTAERQKVQELRQTIAVARRLAAEASDFDTSSTFARCLIQIDRLFPYAKPTPMTRLTDADRAVGKRG